MSSGTSDGVEPVELPPTLLSTTGSISGAGKRFALVAARFNEAITSRLVVGAVEALTQHGVAAEDLEVIHVPGAFELPSACRHVVQRGRIDGVVALGCVIRGETAHFEYVAGAAAHGLMDVSVDSSIPIVFGVLTTDSFQQALDRAGTGRSNKGWEAAVTALEMTNLLSDLR